MKIIPLEDRTIESFTPEEQERLKPVVGGTPHVHTAKRMKRIYAMCEENLDATARLIQEEIPTDIVTYPDFAIRKDEFLDVFVVKSRQDQPALEIAVIIAIHKVCMDLENTSKALGYMMAMGFKSVQVSEYRKLMRTIDNVDKAENTLRMLEGRIGALNDAVRRIPLEGALAPGTDAFHDLLKSLSSFIKEDKGFREYLAAAIEMHSADTLREPRRPLDALGPKPMASQ